MSRRKRTILFLSLAILFLIIAPLAVLYSLGWRFNWETKKVFQPGVFYFKVWPKNAQIYLDGGLKKKTDFFFGSVLIENLLPKKYDVEIKKEGFHGWEKTLEVKERGVAEVKNIILVPENPNFGTISKGIEDFFFSPDGKKIILKEENKEENNEDSEKLGWSLKLFEIEKNLKSHLINERDILARRSPPQAGKGGPKERVQLIELKFSPDLNRILLKLGLNEKLGYYILEIDKTPSVLTYLDFLTPDVEQVYFNPKNPQKLLVQKAGVLVEADPTDKKVSSPVFDDVISCSILPEVIYCLDGSGFLIKTNFSFDRVEKLNLIPFPQKKETKYEIVASNSYVFLKENGILYFFEEKKKSFQKILESVKELKLSSDSKKLVYFNNYEIWVLFLEKDYDQPQREAGEQLFLARFSEKIDNVFWLTNNYLIFNVGDKIRTSSPAGLENFDSSLHSEIKIAEIDNRDRINIVELGEFKEAKIFWNQTDKKLYVLSEKTLYASEKLVP